MKRVLVIAYFFPPLGGAGVQRTLKHVKYLPEFGWEPVVLTTSSRSYPALDPSLEAEIPPGVPVIRTGGADAVARMRTLASGAFERVGLRGVAAATVWPDTYAEWSLGAVRAGVRAAREHDVDAIYVTSPPFSAALAAMRIQRATGLPLVADFRDEWAANVLSQPLPRRLQERSRKLEQRVVERASAITVAASHYEIGGTTGHTTITNGVDPDDLPDSAPAIPDDRFRLTFVGSLYGDIDAAVLAGALARLAERGEIDPVRFELRIVGNDWLAERVDAGRVPVTHTGYVPHARAVEEMRCATALLSYTPPQSVHTPGKIFEYLAAGRPILVVANPEGFGSTVVDELGAGVTADVRDSEAVEAAVKRLYDAWDAGGLDELAAPRERVLERFSRKKLAGELADVLNAAKRS
jgi:glycosyltransferase involved in cell wall biosynthesis